MRIRAKISLRIAGSISKKYHIRFIVNYPSVNKCRVLSLV